jgi:hypothetical protein
LDIRFTKSRAAREPRRFCAHLTPRTAPIPGRDQIEAGVAPLRRHHVGHRVALALAIMSERKTPQDTTLLDLLVDGLEKNEISPTWRSVRRDGA